MSRSNDPIVKEALARMELVLEADVENRSEAMDALRFSAGQQWPDEIAMQRKLDRRPCLTINKTDTFVRAVVNNMRQQRPRIKIHPVSDGADQVKSEIYEGLIRHIEVQSHAEQAYDTAAEYQVRMGWGYWRIVGEYPDDESFDQELTIKRIRNPFSVYFDPASQEPDGSDAEWCIITGIMRKVDFERQYPKAKVSGLSTLGEGDMFSDVAKKDDVVVAEYYRIEQKKDVIIKLSDGRKVWKSDIRDEAELEKNGVVSVESRESIRRVVKWSKISAIEELESRELPGKHIPVVPCYGSELLDDGKVRRYGMVKNLIDPQRSYNFWRTSETEMVALAPKSPWLMAEGQDEGHEDEWDRANIKNFSRLIYRPARDENGNTLPPPQRLPVQQIPAGAVNAAMAASEDLKAVAGMFDPALGAPGQETSGNMVQQRQMQSDMSNYHFYDNLTRSVRWTGLLLLELIPYYYDTERTIRIIGEDGKPDSVTINQQTVGATLNDLTVGRYDVVVETGPGYDTKRQQASAMMIDTLRFIPQVGQVAGDVIVGQMDWPGAQAIAERLAMANPLSQIDAKLPAELDPDTKAMVAHLMAQNQQLQNQLQQLNMEKQAKVFGLQEKEQFTTQREQMKESAETHRLHVRELGENLRAHVSAQTKVHDANTRASTAIQTSLIDSQTDLALGHDRRPYE